MRSAQIIAPQHSGVTMDTILFAAISVAATLVLRQRRSPAHTKTKVHRTKSEKKAEKRAHVYEMRKQRAPAKREQVKQKKKAKSTAAKGSRVLFTKEELQRTCSV